MKIKKVYTLMKKDIITCFTDKNILIMIAMPVLFCIFYTMIMTVTGSGYILMLCSLFNLSITPVCILPALIADEKDKGTLITLYRAGVRNREFICAKMGTVIIITLVMAGGMFWTTRADTQSFFLYLILNLIVSAALLPAGAIVAVLAKDQISANVYSTLPVLIFMTCPALSVEADVCKQFSKILPTNVIVEILFRNEKEAVLFTRDGLISILVCFLWFVLEALIFLYLYKRKGIGLDHRAQS
ncbi:MAG: hypothetical protein K2J90_08470 [Lachnospiraceae bacterium]|nr:hypothetical protein [Lachnospiraceae bacterium]